MAKYCDICGEKVGFRNKFRCQDGYLCKKCYGIVSNHFAKTIVNDTIEDLKKIYKQNTQSLESLYFEGLKGYHLKVVPDLSPEELVQLKNDKSSQKMIEKMSIVVDLKGKPSEEIILLSSPVRSSSYQFRKAYDLAIRILKELDDQIKK